MRSSELDLIFIAGLGGSEPEHWQRRWAAKLPTARFVEQANWTAPKLAPWVEAVVEAAARAERPIVFVAHSLGVATLVHAGPGLPTEVKGAFLVAPPSEAALAQIGCADFAYGNAPPPDCAARLVASRDDRYCPFSEAQALSQRWDCPLIDAGNAGHINVASGHGPWPEGLMQLAGFLKGLN